MNVKIEKEILKQVQNDILVMPNQVLNLIQDLRISASDLNFSKGLFLVVLPVFQSQSLGRTHLSADGMAHIPTAIALNRHFH